MTKSMTFGLKIGLYSLLLFYNNIHRTFSFDSHFGYEGQILTNATTWELQFLYDLTNFDLFSSE